MSSLIHKPADLKSLHVRASPRSSRCPTVVWDENQDQDENIPTEEEIAEEIVANTEWIGGTAVELGNNSSIQDGRGDDERSDCLCVGWLGGISSGDGDGEGDEIALHLDGYGSEVDGESKEEDRVASGGNRSPALLRATVKRAFDHSEKNHGQDLRSGTEVEPGRRKGRGQVTQRQPSETGTGTVVASEGRESEDDFKTSASGVDGGVGKICMPQMSVIHQWSSLPQMWVIDNGFEEGPSSEYGTEGNFNLLGDSPSLNPTEHRGLGGGGEYDRDILRRIESDGESSSNRDSKVGERRNMADTAEQTGQDTDAGTEAGTEEEADGGGSATAPGGESRGRASTVFLSLWDIAAYGTGALGARLEDIERYGLRSRGYLDDESDTEEVYSDIEGDSWADTDDSGGGINMFKSSLFSGGYTAIVSAADLLKTTAQTVISFPRRFSLPSIYSRPAGRKSSLSPGMSATHYLSRSEGAGSSDTSADQLRGNKQKTQHEHTVSIPADNLDGILDRGNQTKITGKTIININKNASTDSGSYTFLSRLMAVKKDFFKKKSPQSNGRDARTPGLFPKLGVDRDADYTLNEGGSLRERGSAHTDRSVLDGAAYSPRPPPGAPSSLDPNSTGTNGKHPGNAPPNGMSQLYTSLPHTLQYSSSALDPEQSRSRSTTLYAQSEAENQSIFSSDSYLPPATLPYGLLSLGTLQVHILGYQYFLKHPVHSAASRISTFLNRFLDNLFSG
jgi:hypothetical protein